MSKDWSTNCTMQSVHPFHFLLVKTGSSTESASGNWPPDHSNRGCRNCDAVWNAAVGAQTSIWKNHEIFRVAHRDTNDREDASCQGHKKEKLNKLRCAHKERC